MPLLHYTNPEKQCLMDGSWQACIHVIQTSVNGTERLRRLLVTQVAFSEDWTGLTGRLPAALRSRDHRRKTGAAPQPVGGARRAWYGTDVPGRRKCDSRTAAQSTFVFGRLYRLYPYTAADVYRDGKLNEVTVSLIGVTSTRYRVMHIKTSGCPRC